MLHVDPTTRDFHFTPQQVAEFQDAMAEYQRVTTPLQRRTRLDRLRAKLRGMAKAVWLYSWIRPR